MNKPHVRVLRERDAGAVRPAQQPRPPAPALRDVDCPACGRSVVADFFDGGARPLATIAWPGSAEEASAMPRYPLDFVRCVSCGHVFNAQFDYMDVPYTNTPNLMYNQGARWRDHLVSLRDDLCTGLAHDAVVVEVGCGDGDFLRLLGEAAPSCRLVGFDVNADGAGVCGNLQIVQAAFEPGRHIPELRPDLILFRHVLEHLSRPAAFLQRVAVTAAWHDIALGVFVEVPCIDRVFETARIVDFYYEHYSHFTLESLSRLFAQTGIAIDRIVPGYDGEVIQAFAHTSSEVCATDMLEQACRFKRRTVANRETIRRTVMALLGVGKDVAIWGGTGKAAAFIQHYGLDAEQFPIVVDSDPRKLGTFVPGTGQEIRAPSHLNQHPVAVILIPAQWRARDVVLEIERRRIAYESILIEHDGDLVDWHRGVHPYRSDARQRPPRGRAPAACR